MSSGVMLKKHILFAIEKPNMDIMKFLTDENFDYPGYREGADIRSYLRERFNRYLSCIDGISSPDSTLRTILNARDKIEFQCNKLIDAINSHYLGHPHLAFQAISESIESVRWYFSRLSSTSKAADWINQRGLYRARKGTYRKYERNELFHISFEKREKVATQRYSIPGLPCLYLGSSLYVCWEELGRPDINSLQVAQFEVKTGKNLSILTIGPAPSVLVAELSKLKLSNQDKLPSMKMMENAATYFSICWPIILSCSLRVSKPKEPFVPEYIIPQLVLQWVTSKESIDGIQYPSITVDQNHVSSIHTINYVFPVKSKINMYGLCNFLARTFSLTEPLSWGIARMYLSHPAVQSATRSSEEDFRLIQGLEMNYFLSEFGAIEMLLRQMETDSVR